MADYFEDFPGIGKELPAKEVSNWLLGDVSRIINAENIDINKFRERVPPERFGQLIVQSHSTINAAIAKDVLGEMFKTAKEAAEIIAQRGLIQISDTEQPRETVSQLITANTQAVADYKAGKEQALKFLVGQVMKATRGRANPRLVNELLKEKLAEVLSGRERG